MTWTRPVPLRPVRFSLDDAVRAGDTWGANCGPGAVAAVCSLTLDELRPFMGEFEQKGYTNPTLMRDTLLRLGIPHRVQVRTAGWPRYGLARIQWEGPWTKPGVPMRVRYRHSHWVGSFIRHDQAPTEVFDINCMSVGGWVSFEEWSGWVVPWLLKRCEPTADGKWHITHTIEVNHQWTLGARHAS